MGQRGRLCCLHLEIRPLEDCHCLCSSWLAPGEHPAENQGAPREQEPQVSHSRRAGCPVLLKASTRVQVGQERPPWILKAIVSHHNHEVAMEPEAYPEHRRLNSGQMAEVDALVKSGPAPRPILESMRSQSVAVHANIRTIYNAKQELI